MPDRIPLDTNNLPPTDQANFLPVDQTAEENQETVAEPESGESQSKPHLIPLDILKELMKNEDIKAIFEHGAGVWEGYTIGQHTLMAMTQFEKYFSHKPLPLNLDNNFFRQILSLHDIGKAKALDMGNKHLQHDHTVDFIEKHFRNQNIPEEKIKIALALVKSDVLGSYLKSNDINSAINQINQLASEANVNVLEFFDLLQIYYQVDAGAYTEDATISDSDPDVSIEGKYSLDRLFEFSPNIDPDKSQMTFSRDVQARIDLLKEKLETKAI